MYLRGCVLAAALAAVGKTSCLLSTASAGASVSVNGTASATVSSPSATSTFSNGTSASTKNFEFFGVNESGPEFGTAIPGVLGTDYIWPTLSTIDTFVNAGMNTIRINFLMERLVPNELTGSLDADYFASLKETTEYITNLGAYAMLNPHNYGRYYGNIITDTAGFQTFWQTVATEFADNDLVIFDTNNEYHDMDQTLVVELNQAAIDGVRAAGATSQWITVEGNAWTGAWTWTSLTNSGGYSNGQTMGDLTDSSNKIIYQMHQYLDSDGSGTSETCVSTTIGAERLQDATAWLKSNGKVAILGEFAAGNNSDCMTAVNGMLDYMVENNDVWLGALWWAAGPWWGDYMYSIEPPSGSAYTYYFNDLVSYE